MNFWEKKYYFMKENENIYFQIFIEIEKKKKE